MFGFFKPGCIGQSTHRRYRQVYAAFCAHHRRRYGLVPSSLISYEAVFLYHLAMESGACPPPSAKTPTCCRLRSDPTNRWNLDRELADFCSDFGLLLVRIKIEDDIRDAGSKLAKLGNRLLKRKFGLADERLNKVASGTTNRIELLVEEHLALEKNSNVETDIESYAKPTSDSFKVIFEAFAYLCKSRGGNVQNFGKIGAAVGQSILIGDCVFDFEKDKAKGQFNPIRSLTEKENARQAALKCLSNLGWACSTLAHNNQEQKLPNTFRRTTCRAQEQETSVVLEIVKSAFGRLASRVEQPNQINGSDGRFEFAASKRRPFALIARGGFCDCDCGGCDCVSCDCFGGDCGICDSADGSCCEGDGNFLCQSAICPCDACICPDNKKPKRDNEKGQETVVVEEFETGITMGPLNPTGVIKISGAEHPAKAQCGFIESGRRVKIVKKETFGYLVDLDEGDSSKQDK